MAFDPMAMGATLDARVLAVMLSVPDTEPLESLAALAGTDILGLRGSMRRLAVRQPGRTWPWAEMSELDCPPTCWPPERLALVV